MKKILLFLLFTASIIAQTTAPSGYTSNYRFRLWNQGANPSADSLNANWTLADTKIKLAYDSAQAKVNLYGVQTIAGKKTFSDGVVFSNQLNTNGLYILGYPLVTDAFGTYLIFNSIDTLATLADVRGSGITGAAFTDDVSMGADVRYPKNDITITTTNFDATNKTFCNLASTTTYAIEVINGGMDGKIIYIKNDASYAITIKDGVGNIQSAGDCVLGLNDTITLIYDATWGRWVELSRSNN